MIDVEIPETFTHYQYVKKIGSGSYGVVVEAYDLTYKKSVAAKIMPRQNLSNINVLEALEQELRVAQSLKHPNITSVFDIVYTKDLIIIVMELCSGGDLLSFLTKNGMVNVTIAKKITFQLLTALSYIHSKGIAHRDIKLENILLDDNMNAKLADFGCCRFDNSSKVAMPCGTLFYMAPEILNPFHGDVKKSDIWSLGIILYIFIAGKFPWSLENNTPENIKKQIATETIQFPQQLSQAILEVLAACLLKDPEQRPTAEKLLDAQWFRVNQIIRPSSGNLLAGKMSHSLTLTDRKKFAGGKIIPYLCKPVVKSTTAIK